MAAVFLSAGLSACVTAPASTSGVGETVTVGPLPPIEVELARTPQQKRTGLMGRTSVPAGTGMAFVYDAPVENAFWMGDVEVDLSIVWVHDDRVVGLAEMRPCPAADATCVRYSPGVPYDLAVETAGGTFTDAGVEVGDAVTTTFAR